VTADVDGFLNVVSFELREGVKLAHGQLPLAQRVLRRMAGCPSYDYSYWQKAALSHARHVDPSGLGRSRRQVTWLTSAE